MNTIFSFPSAGSQAFRRLAATLLVLLYGACFPVKAVPVVIGGGAQGRQRTLTVYPVKPSIIIEEGRFLELSAPSYVSPVTTLYYQWYYGADKIIGATSSVYRVLHVSRNNEAGGAGSYFCKVSTSPIFAPSVGNLLTTNSGTIVLTVNTKVGDAPNLPRILSNPASLDMALGAAATFSVSLDQETGVSYQWKKDGANIPEAVAKSYGISSVKLTDAGKYSVVVTNSAGATTSSSATLTVTPTAPLVPTTSISLAEPVKTRPVAPSPVHQYIGNPKQEAVAPASPSVKPFEVDYYIMAVGYDTNPVMVDLGVAVTLKFPRSVPGYSWAWEKNGKIIPGAVSYSYTLFPVRATDDGSYVLIATAIISKKQVRSSALVLVVNNGSAGGALAKPKKASDQTVSLGEEATFFVGPLNIAGVQYQWKKNGVLKETTSTNMYRITPQTLADFGAYTVTIISGASTSPESDRFYLKNKAEGTYFSD